MPTVLNTASNIPQLVFNTLREMQASLLSSLPMARQDDADRIVNYPFLTDDTVEGHVRVADADFDLNAKLEIKNHQKIDDLLEDLDLIGIRDLFETWDGMRALTPSVYDYTTSALRHLRQRLAVRLIDPNGLNNELIYDIDLNVLDSLDEYCALHPRDHIAAGITARLHLDAGWAARITEPNDVTGLDIMRAHFEIARDFVTRFDPIAYDSPMLAEVQYRMCAGLENGDERLRGAFEDWKDLCPGSQDPYLCHSFFLQPNWFGSCEEIDRMAWIATSETSKEWGVAAYALMYLEVLQYDGDALDRLDINQFFHGLSDLIRSTANDPRRVTQIIDQVARVGSGADGLFARNTEWLHDRHQAIRTKLREFMTNHLTAFEPRGWEGSKKSFLHLVASVFPEEIERGALISFNSYGLEIIQEPPNAGAFGLAA